MTLGSFARKKHQLALHLLKTAEKL